MDKYDTPQRIATAARMNRMNSSETILLVEGSTDTRVCENFVNLKFCKITYTGKKDKAINALSILEKDGVRGVLAIVDADFWHLDGIKPESFCKNLLVTDTHDIDTMILYSRALDKMLSEYANSNKINKLGKPIREILLQNGLKIGYIRWVSSINSLFLDFKELSFNQFIDKRNLKVNCGYLLNELKRNPKNSCLNHKDIKYMIGSLVSDHDPWQVCQGHDLIKILTIGLKEIFGNHTNENIDYDIVSRNLRLSYDFICFYETNLYVSIIQWEANNPGFKVLIDFSINKLGSVNSLSAVK